MGVLAPNENQEDVPSPVRVYLNDDGMTVQLFYEGHPDHATNSTIINVPLYASQTPTVPDDAVPTPPPPPCDDGVALPSTLYTVTLAPYGAETYNGFSKQLDASQCFPQTTNGVVAQAEIIMTENP